MAIGICPTVDFAFKLLFGSPEHANITIHFLNALLDDIHPITTIQIRNPFLGKDDEDDKLSVLDILATDEHGRIFNIEMQTSSPPGMSQRLAYYAASLYSDQLTEGVGYSALRPAISICVLTNAMFPNDFRLHLDFRLRDSSGLILTNDLQVHLLQLSNLGVTAQNVSVATVIEQWAYFLLNADKLTLEDIHRLFHDREFREAAGVLDMISKTPEQQMKYDSRLKFQRDEAARIELARNEALREGIEQGHVEGLRKGELFGQIKLLQQLLGVIETTPNELTSYSDGQLSELAEQLQQQLRNRGE